MESELLSKPSTRTGGRQATNGVIPGQFALSVGKPALSPPPNWRWAKLTDVARLETGHTPSRRHPEYWDGDIPWIGIKDAVEHHGRTIYDTMQHVTQAGIDNSSARLLPEGTVCLSRTASIGYVTVMGRPMATSQDFVNWVCGPDIDPVFLKGVLLAEQESLWRFAHGTTHQTIYFPEVKAFHVCLPPISKQRAIAEVLGVLDDKIELNRKMNATLDELARSIFRSWFVDFDPVRAKMEGREPFGMDADTAELFPDRFVDSPLGPIPEGWEVKTLGDIAENVRENVPADALTAEDHYVGLEHFTKRNIALAEWESADAVSSNKSRFRNGDVLFGKLRPYFHKVAIAPIDGVCSTDILVIRPKVDAYGALTACAAASDQVVALATSHSSGTRMPRAKWTDLASFPLALPMSCAVVERFEAVIGPMIRLINQNVHESRTLAELRDTLLPELISGRIRVPDVEKQVSEVI